MDADDPKNLAALLRSFDLPKSAADWVLMLWQVIQCFDDFADGGDVSRPDLDAMILNALVNMPSNAFFRAHQDWLVPVMLQAVIKWQASDAAERAGNASALSFMWRAGFYDVVSQVCAIVHGPMSAQALLALSLYGERFEDYLEEFHACQAQ